MRSLAGNDSLRAADVLDGGQGNDTLEGGGRPRMRCIITLIGSSTRMIQHRSCAALHCGRPWRYGHHVSCGRGAMSRKDDCFRADA
jgi:hypothetical protein